MLYDVQIGGEARKGLSYAELIMLPIDESSLIRRHNSSEWISASNCIELSHILIERKGSQTQYNMATIAEDANMEDGMSMPSSIETSRRPSDIFVSAQEHNHSIPSRCNHPMEYAGRIPVSELQTYSAILDSQQRVSNMTERIFIPTAEYFKCKQKRKSALIGVLSLGLAALTLYGIGNAWRSNIFQGTSMDQGGVGFVLKCLSFCLVTSIIAIPYFIYSVCALIYYTYRLHSMRNGG